MWPCWISLLLVSPFNQCIAEPNEAGMATISIHATTISMSILIVNHLNHMKNKKTLERFAFLHAMDPFKDKESLNSSRETV